MALATGKNRPGIRDAQPAITTLHGTVPVLALELQPNTIALNLKQLVRSRMLIQANSGGGKSRALRYLLELTHGHIQQFVFDPEGEFSTLREHFPFVVAGRDGDVAAHPDTAAVLCRRLMSLNTSAVLDLYDLAPSERRQFVRRFLEELMNLPRADWHPVLVALDEAHVYAPERGKGEAESTEAVITLCTQGRKRGLAPILATQRLAKLHKDAAAELFNKLIGLTSLDDDILRAGNELGFDKQQRQALRNLQPGTFFAFGPAIAREVVLLRTGEVRTTHPEPGQLAPPTPPPPDVLQAAIAQLQDLPQAAEEEARDLASAQAELMKLRRQLQTLRKAATNVAPDLVDVERRIAAAVKQARAPLEARIEEQAKMLEETRLLVAQLGALFESALPMMTETVAASEGDGTAIQHIEQTPSVQRQRPAIQHASSPTEHVPSTVEAEVKQLRTIPSIAAKLAQIEAHLEPSIHRYIPRILVTCWNVALRPDDVVEGRGTLSPSTYSRFRAASRALLAINFLVDEGEGRLRVNHHELERLRSLHQAIHPR
jgi:hypothetical protein